VSRRMLMHLMTPLWIIAVVLVLGGVPSAEARRTNISGTGGDSEGLPYAVFTDQALTTSDVTSSVKVPVAMTEGCAALIDVQGLTATNTVTITRLERTKSSETKYGYPVPAYVQQEIVISVNGPFTYPIAWTEGVEYITFKAKSSLASGVRVTIQAVTQ
jgi:hypothetical protein